MTIVHSEAPWGQPQEEKLAPKERTHPMRALSRNNNTTTRLKRGPNPLSGVVILVLIFFFWFIFFGLFCLFFLFVFYNFFWIFFGFFGFLDFFIFIFLFIYFFCMCFFFLFVFFLLFFLFLFLFYICAYMLFPWGQPQQTIKSPGYREVLILSLGS